MTSIGNKKYLSTVITQNARQNKSRILDIQQRIATGMLSLNEGRERIKGLLIENASMLEPGSEEERFLNGLL